MKRLLSTCAALLATLAFSAAVAAPVSYVNTPLDTVQATVNSALANVNTTLAPTGSGTIGSTINIPATASAVNQFNMAAGATTVVPVLSTGGASADTNIGLALNGNGTGSVYLSGSTAANAAVAAAHGTTNVNQIILTGTNTGSAPSIVVGGSGADANVGLTLAGNGTGVMLLGGTTTTLAGLQIAQTASRVNDVILTPTATGSVPTLLSGGAGSDANIGLLVGTVGTGSLSLGGPTVALAPLKATPVASGVNQVVVTGAATGAAAAITETGDANRNLNVTAAGTGLVIIGQAICTVTGATPQTCNGQRGIATTASLSTAAVTDATPYVINNSSVTASSLVMCQIQSYAGTYSTNGNPIIESCVPGSGTITVNLRNVNAANALSGAVGMGFTVLN